MPRPPGWTDAEVCRLKKLAGTMMPAEIAKAIGRTRNSVIDYCYRNRISLATTKNIKPWTDSDVKILRQHSGKLTHEQIGKLLGRSRRAVACKAVKLGISAPLTGGRNHATIHSDEDVELCRQLFDDGMSRKDIAEKMEIPYQTVVDYLLYRIRR